MALRLLQDYYIMAADQYLADLLDRDFPGLFAQYAASVAQQFP